MNKQLHHVVVVGGGFGGLAAARELDGDGIRVTLIDRQNHHVFQPLLYEVATAKLSATDVALPLRHLLKNQHNVDVLMGEVKEVRPESRCLVMDDGRPIEFDTLILACGATHSYFGNESWAEHAPGLKSVNDALSLREKILLAFERADASSTPVEQDEWMCFTVIGGGPTGVELAGALAELAHKTLPNEYRHIDTRKSRIQLIEAGPSILPTFPEALQRRATQQLEDLGVEVITGRAVTSVFEGGYALEDTYQRSRTVLWAAGVKASPIGKSMGAQVDRAGRILVDEFLRVRGHHNVYAIGDNASVDVPGMLVPGIAPAAKQMGQYVGRQILRTRRGHRTRPFEYVSRGKWATVGTLSAVVSAGPFRISGPAAWFAWLCAHVYFLTGARNRTVVALNWAMTLIAGKRAARVVARPVKALAENESF